MYRIVKIKNKIEENKNVFTLLFEDDIKINPGQFAMVWIPGIDEFPMSFSYTGELKGFTFKVLGEGTRNLAKLSIGDRLFYRGPYGKYYTIEGEKALFVAGGTGIASLAPFIESSTFKKKYAIIGAKTKEELFFINRIESNVDSLLIYTEDGSLGSKGLVTDGIHKFEYDIIYACGPEKMLRKIIDMNVKNIQASLERYMKCGIGICDSCTINGFRVCVDGPVFRKEELLKMDELGIKTRLPSGKEIKL